MPASSAGRVIAGAARGMRLVAPGEGTRPLGDRAKQTLFAILQGGALIEWPVPFLDLFAGSGAAGIEALSRGSPRVVFVERDPAAVRTIRENLRRTRLEEGLGGRASHSTWESMGSESPQIESPQVEIVQADVLRYLASDDRPGATNAPEPFGAALLDPPYGDAAMLPALERLGRSEPRWLGEGAVVVAKHFWRDRLPPRIGSLDMERERRFGETMLTFYRALGER
jgi:16S rRNA (guanine966-N2)-methyltransferase